MIRDWLADLSARGLAAVDEDAPAAPLALATVAAAHRVLRQMLNQAVADDLIPRNPAIARNPEDGPLVPSVDLQERPVLTGAEMHALWNTTRDTDPLHALWVLALTTGARVGELLALTWNDVRLDGADGGEIEIRRTLERLPGQGWRLATPKTKRSRRTLPLLPVAVDALRWHRTRQEANRTVAGASYRDYDSGGFVFAGPTGAPLRGDTVNNQWHRALRRATEQKLRAAHPRWDAAKLRAEVEQGTPALRLHDARHSAATFWLLDSEQPMRTVSDLLGHSTMKLLADRYSHVLPAHLRQSAAAVAARLARHGQDTDRSAPAES